jgi:nucleoside-diphosphate-sugar epimerase
VFIDAALKDQPMEIHGDGQPTHSFTSISNQVDGILRTMCLPKVAGEIFNLGNVHEINILDLTLLVWRLAGKGEPKVKVI